MPQNCAQANAPYNCCYGNVLYDCGAGGSGPLTSVQCSVGTVCGWDDPSGAYLCVNPPGHADPSGTYPMACQ